MDTSNRVPANELSWRAYLTAPWWCCSLLFLLCGGCGTAPGEETRLFTTAFTTFDGASQTLFDDLAIAERRRGKYNAEALAKLNAKKLDNGAEGKKSDGCHNVWQIVNEQAKVIYPAFA